jgi:hypothetical protein
VTVHANGGSTVEPFKLSYAPAAAATASNDTTKATTPALVALPDAPASPSASRGASVGARPTRSMGIRVGGLCDTARLFVVL